MHFVQKSRNPKTCELVSTLSGPTSLLHHCHRRNTHDEDVYAEPEPSDEDIWLAEIARQVEADARPLFEIVWLWLGRRALQLDEDEPAG